MNLFKSHTLTFLYLVPSLSIGIYCWLIINQQNYQQSQAGPGGGGVIVNDITFETVALAGLITTSIAVFALFASSVRQHRHDPLGVLAVLVLAAFGWTFNHIFFERIFMWSARGVVEIYFATLLPLLLGSLIIASRKWGWVRTKNWKPGLDIEVARSTNTLMQAIVALTMCLVTMAVWWWVMQNWVEPGFIEYDGPRDPRFIETAPGFITTHALQAGIAAKAILAGAVLWLFQLVPMADRTRLYLLGSKSLLVVFMLWALSIGDSVEVAILVASITGFWLIGTMYLLAPLANIEVRFLPWQPQFARGPDSAATV